MMKTIETDKSMLMFESKLFNQNKLNKTFFFYGILYLVSIICFFLMQAVFFYKKTRGVYLRGSLKKILNGISHMDNYDVVFAIIISVILSSFLLFFVMVFNKDKNHIIKICVNLENRTITLYIKNIFRNRTIIKTYELDSITAKIDKVTGNGLDDKYYASVELYKHGSSIGFVFDDPIYWNSSDFKAIKEIAQNNIRIIK